MPNVIRPKILVYEIKMFKKRKLVTLQRIVKSKKFFLFVTLMITFSFVAVFYLADIDSGSLSRRRRPYRPSIYRISWLEHDRSHPLLESDEGVTKKYLKSLRKKETDLMKQQVKKHKKYIFNYTRCLSSEFAQLEENVNKLSHEYPLSFGEVMNKLHDRCSVEIFGDQRNRCQFKKLNLVGPLKVKREHMKMGQLKRELDQVRLGGVWSPTDCVPKAKVAVIIPFRDRSEHLVVLLRQLHPVLMRQNLLYRVFVIEQADEYPFNRGKLMNVGYREAMKVSDFDCFVFHDVDLIPENDKNDYGCPASPRHMSVAVDKFSYTLPYNGLFGGVEMFTKAHFALVNGFSNSYWGWGAEDDDMYRRIVKNGLKLSRPSLETGRYSMIKHESSEKPPDRLDKLKVAEVSFESNGLVTLLYNVIKKQENLLYTLVRVDLKMEEDMIY